MSVSAPRGPAPTEVFAADGPCRQAEGRDCLEDEGFVLASEWLAVACSAADKANRTLRCRQRGSMLVALSGSARVIPAVFSHDGVADGRGRRALALLRHALEEAGLCELGFGLSRDGLSWALLVRHDETQDVERLRAFLEDAVAQAWRLAGGGC
jgi:hypothetical protein